MPITLREGVLGSAMNCCHSQSANKLFSRFAKTYRRRFQRKGFEAPQKTLLQALLATGIHSCSVLEIGCGVGQFHQALLEQGAASAIGVDLADEMILEARGLAREKNLQDRTQYIQGDFMELANIPPADITVLDKVICCYPDGKGMVKRALQHTQQHLALIYPRERLIVRWGIAVGALIFRLIGSNFRPYFYPPEQVHGWVADQGFSRSYRHEHMFWLIEIYSKDYMAKES